MELHEAIKKARKELGMTQQTLADLAGIERKQLSVLESGGNVTLATVRKVLAHLPNMPAFQLGEIPGHVGQAMSPEAQAEAVATAMRLLGSALQTLFGALIRGRVPADEEAGDLHEANRLLYRVLGRSAEDYDREIQQRIAERPPAEPYTVEGAAKALASIAEVTKVLAEGGFMPQDEDKEKEQRSSTG